MSALKYWLWLSSLKGVGAKSAAEIIEEFGSPERAFFADKDAIEASKLTSAEKTAISDKSLMRAGKIMHDCRENGITILTINDASYPERLRNIYDPPVVLYMKGNVPFIDEEAAIAIVGTRSCTPYGVKNAERIGYEIARCGGVVVTGLARGIDSAAAFGAIRAGGRVIGVLGCGLDIVYPRGNERLFEDVCVNGGIISEYPPGMPPMAGNFPIRNRIMSGISSGVLVIEAPVHSGALITAARALEQGRDVFVLPGNVDASSCEGSNQLLREGATAVMRGEDIISEYTALFPEKLRIVPKDEMTPLDTRGRNRLVEREASETENEDAKEQKEPVNTEKEQKTAKIPIDNHTDVAYSDLSERPDGISDDEYEVLKVLTRELQADEIVELSGIPASRALAALTLLEIQGYIVQKAGKHFTRK